MSYSLIIIILNTLSGVCLILGDEITQFIQQSKQQKTRIKQNGETIADKCFQNDTFR